jgi:spermidine/putrescine transport system ATP-binding protein
LAVDKVIGRHAVEAQGVTKIFDGDRGGGVVALDQASIGIHPNEFFTLLGPSGCGKTTLLRLIAGFEQPTSGVILLDGEQIDRLPPFRRPVNTVFQSYALFPHMSVAENVAFGLEMLGTPRDRIKTRVAEMLALVQLSGMANRRPNQLSGGQQQRVALARALANAPKVLLLDEPLSALDLKLRKEMQIELKRLQRDTGITFIFVTHDQEEALTMSDRIAVMSGGRILQVGSPREIYEEPATRFVADFIGETDFIQARMVAAMNGHARYRLASGDEVEGVATSGLGEGGEVTLSIRPERLRLVGADQPGLRGTIENVVYFGTDTTYHVALAGGAGTVRIRQQNQGQPSLATGAAVNIALPPEAVRALVD